MAIQGFKLTKQRATILGFIKENYSHPNVEDVYSFVRKKMPSISKKTVYRNLKFLSENNYISEVNIRGVYRFEPSLKPHHHVYCKVCGKLIDYHSDDLVEYSMKVASKIRDFEIESTATYFYGVCKACKGDKNGKI